SSAATDWSEIVGLYDLLLRIDPSPVVELNRAVAIAMRDGPAAGLREIEGLLAKGELDNYPLAHSAKAELCRRVGQMDEAKASFGKALALTSQEQQRRFLQRRLAEIKRSFLEGGCRFCGVLATFLGEGRSQTREKPGGKAGETGTVFPVFTKETKNEKDHSQRQCFPRRRHTRARRPPRGHKRWVRSRRMEYEIFRR